ncbi:telomere binding protein [Gnomoniopsis smithogilvyi]|uniref:Telomere binding protein n=1 Tax=Gnomoniopsis smithogilvyi TaxID=1191159 RepID=A0A9W8Z3A0_9PEZI|nr:telomere binding protein [Gnomoniopsis smithogilvyi]
MDELLSPVNRTDTRSSGNKKPLLQEVQPSTPVVATPSSLKTSSVAEVIDILKSEPDYETLVSVLRLLVQDGRKLGGFSIVASGPEAAKIIHILVTEIVPNYWTLLKGSTTDDGDQNLHLLLESLRSLAGINAILLRLRALTHELKGETPGTKRIDVQLNLTIVLDLLGEVLNGDDRVAQIWESTTSDSDAMKRRILAREFINVLGGGRIVSLSAEGEAIASQAATISNCWTVDGAEYTRWLTRNIVTWSQASQRPDDTKIQADLFSKAMHLGYPNAAIRLLVSASVNGPQQDNHLRLMFDSLAHTEQRLMLFSLLKHLAELAFSRLNPSDASSESRVISAAAEVINRFVVNEPKYASLLVTWLTSPTGAGLGDSIGIRRAVLAVLATDNSSIITVFEQSLSQFGDFLYIKHTPILQQEVHAQVLLLSAGYLQRASPMKLALMVKGAGFMRMVSKRLEASQIRARLLGMIVGEALSQLVEKIDKKLDFKMEETNSADALWYKSLVEVSDAIGPVGPLTTSEKLVARKETSRISQKTSPKPQIAPPVSKVKAIIEEVNSDEDMDDDIIPLTKPEDDDEDSDDDPETVRRDKPKAPVYVRNLITYLRNTEDYDRQRLALITAPTLIRRKANFGTEVKEHAEELATLLIGMQDKYDIENFYEVKLQGMIAIIIAQPQTMGPWFAKTFFDGDFSMAQRSSVLTVLGLGARELAGYATSEYASAAKLPSQALPERMRKLYVEDTDSSSQVSPSSALKALPANALDTISKTLTSDFMAPLAANAADAATGPDALKLTTFTSRLDQQQKANAKAKTRVRAIPNTTAQLIATSFFFPLTARFQSALHSSAGRARGIVFQPYLLSLYLRTLALLLHAAGPSTLALPDMTNELWGLLLGSSVRAHAVGDMGVTHAVLFALLTILEVNDNRMRDICQTMSREVIETQEWVAQIFGGMRGEDSSGEEAAVRALAAGCLVRIREGMEKYRMLLMGDMIG